MSTAELSRCKVRHVPPERPYRRSAGLRRRPGFGGPRCCGSTPGSTRKSRRGRIILTHLGRVLAGPCSAGGAHAAALVEAPGLENALHGRVEEDPAPREDRRQFSRHEEKARNLTAESCYWVSENIHFSDPDAVA